MVTHSTARAWRISWAEEPGELVHGVTKEQTDWKWLNRHTRDKIHEGRAALDYHHVVAFLLKLLKIEKK